MNLFNLRKNWGVKMKRVNYAIVRPVPDTYDQCVRTNIEQIDVALAKRQHIEYCMALQRLGLKLIWIVGDNNLPDSCFVEDTSIVLGKKAIICNMRVKSRAGEVTEVARVLEKLKEIHYIKQPATMDGGDVLRVQDQIFVGLTTRTNLHAVNQLKRIIKGDCKVVPVKVHDILHLKSRCTYLGNNCVIIADKYFNTEFLNGFKKIVVPREEEYAANCISINKKILMAKGHPKTKKLIEKEGFIVDELDMSEFYKGEGALTCLSIRW